MLNASLNWSSLIGLLLMLWSIPSAAMGAFQIFFVLQRRSDTSPQVIIKTIFLVFQSLGRLIGMPLCGSILFFQGWRLDPILQFGVMLLGIGIVVEYLGITKSGEHALEEQQQILQLNINQPMMYRK